jgi:DNA-directed RNA polymerase delta subunit
MRFKKLGENEWGLQEWRHINPKSIHDKALIVMRKIRKPMHFIQIANAISAEAFDNRPVTVQAVHNDLIRYTDFVLVGRGMYALREWGYDPGTVADVIASILKEHGPLTKKEIVKRVQDQRDVKVGTISLNLQKEKAFTRVGRAVYNFDESHWNPKKSGRGRKKKALLELEGK